MMQSTPLSNVLRGLLLLTLSPLVLPGQNSDPNYRPGTTDPAGNPRNLTLFRDEQIYSLGLPSATGNPWRAATLSFDGNLNPTSSVAPLPWSSDVPVQEINAQSVAARIVHQDKDDIFVVQRSGASPSTLVGRFADNSGSTNVTSSMYPRLAGYADFFSVSAGDLDNLYDADGNYHDEVVVAWTQPEVIMAGYSAIPYLAVLNYNSKDPSNPTITTIRVGRDEQFCFSDGQLTSYNSAIQHNYDFSAQVPQPADNIVATAIGDFDGDGKNEIALAYIKGTLGAQPPSITVIIYRYSNDGMTASLTPVNSYDLSIPNSVIAKSSLVATLSLTAGNFDGSGVDQLLVGTAAWWGTVDPAAVFLSYKPNTLWSKPVAFLLTAGQTQGTITGASANQTDSTKTDFTVNLGSGVYVPQAVTIAGAKGTWAQINGTWAVTPSTTGTGFTLDIDSSAFGSFQGQTVTVTTAAPLAQADFATFEPIPGTTSGGIEVDDTDVDAYIRVQLVPGLFHYDPSNGYDARRRQIAMAWNSRAAVRYTNLTQNADTHLALLQVTPDDKIQVAATQNFLIGNWQLFQTLSMTAGALIGDNLVGNPPTNDPTWSLYFSGTGIEFDLNQPFGSRNVYTGMVAGVWKVSTVSGDATKLTPTFVCSDKATSDSYSPTYQGAPLPVCPIWVDAETAIKLTPTSPSGNLNYLRLPAVAADLNGNSLKLGAPLHMELTNPGKADFILEQPPQHAAWLDTGNGPSVLTVSRYPSFNTSMSTSNTTSYQSQTKNHTDWTAGVSEKVTAQASWALGADAGPLADWSEQSTAKLSARVSYDYDHVHDDYTSGYDSYTTGQGATTGTDDFLIVESQILDLWRYRIYGQDTATGDPNNPNAFYDIVIPGPFLVSKPGGKDVEWYQPQHEVGNILSYPEQAQACSPTDIGAITIPNLNISNQVIPLISCQQEFYNGNSSNLSLTFDNKTGSGDSTDYTNKVSTGLDFTYTYRVDFELFENGGQFQASSDTDVHGGQDWGQLNSSDSSASGATGITLNSPQGDSEHAYPYFPIFYNTAAGGLKVAYGVGDITSSSTAGGFWINNYAQLPDPALNLPGRFDATYSSNNDFTGWKPDTTIARKSMKGFVARKSTIDPITGNYPLLGSNAQDGDKVLLEARVYNYSISTTPASFAVQFSVIPYNSTSNNEICANIPTTGKGGRVCPASARTVIGTGTTQPTGGTTTFSLNGRDNSYAYLLWDTTGFGPPSTAGASEYRVYVDLMSNTDELYPAETPCTAFPCEDNFSNETNVDPGQNNEGWGLVAVAKRSLGGPLGGSKSVNATHGSLDTGDANGAPTQALASADMIAAKHRRKNPKPLVAFLFQPLSLRLTAFSSERSNLHGHVSIFDGEPGRRNTTTIAIRTVRGVSPDGTSSWFTWIPKKKGLHHLYAVIQNTTGTTPLGDLIVRVRRAPGDLNEDGRVDRHDLNMLQRDLKKAVAESACGDECDLDGDGKITQKDADLMAQLCDSEACAFPGAEYVGGASPAEPDMGAVRSADNAASAAFFAAHPEDREAMSSADTVATTQLYRAELERKQGLRSIQYWYKGKPVSSGPFAHARTERVADARQTRLPIQ